MKTTIMNHGLVSRSQMQFQTESGRESMALQLLGQGATIKYFINMNARKYHYCIEVFYND